MGTIKLAIYTAMLESKMRKTDLARRLGCHLMQINRLLDLQHASRIDQLEAALNAMDRVLSIRVQKAPAVLCVRRVK